MQAAMEALILVAESGGPTMFARIGVMRALNRHVERVFNPDRKEHHSGRKRARSMKLGRCPLDKFFVQPMTTVVTPPNLSAHKPTRNCASRYDNPVQMPGRCP